MKQYYTMSKWHTFYNNDKGDNDDEKKKESHFFVFISFINNRT